MKWAFIDYENVGNLEKIDLSIYQKIIIFLGAKQPKIDFGEKKYDKPLEIIVIQLKATQSNNLDFHLSYYLGCYESTASENVTFDIISNDNGFAPLIAHIKANGRICKHIKLATVENISAKLLHSLTSKPKEKRPKKVDSLRNHIASHMGIKGNQIAIQGYLNQLINDKVISVSGDKVSYHR